MIINVMIMIVIKIMTVVMIKMTMITRANYVLGQSVAKINIHSY